MSNNAVKELCESVENELAKDKKQKVKQQLKDLIKKRTEHERSIRLLNIEIDKVKTDFEAGIL